MEAAYSIARLCWSRLVTEDYWSFKNRHVGAELHLLYRMQRTAAKTAHLNICWSESLKTMPRTMKSMQVAFQKEMTEGPARRDSLQKFKNRRTKILVHQAEGSLMWGSGAQLALGLLWYEFWPSHYPVRLPHPPLVIGVLLFTPYWYVLWLEGGGGGGLTLWTFLPLGYLACLRWLT